MYFAFSYHISDSAVTVHNLKSGNQFSVKRGYKLLRYDGLKKLGKLYSYLLLLVGREYVYYAVYGIGCAHGVKG